MALKDFPEIKAAFDKLSTEKGELESQITPLREKYNALQVEIERLVAEQKAISNRIKTIEQPRMVEISQQLSAMARATGGRSLSGG